MVSMNGTLRDIDQQQWAHNIAITCLEQGREQSTPNDHEPPAQNTSSTCPLPHHDGLLPHPHAGVSAIDRSPWLHKLDFPKFDGKLDPPAIPQPV